MSEQPQQPPTPSPDAPKPPEQPAETELAQLASKIRQVALQSGWSFDEVADEEDNYVLGLTSPTGVGHSLQLNVTP